MNVLVFGGYGNLGSLVVKELESNDHNVFIVDQMGELDINDKRHPNFRGCRVEDVFRSCQEDSIQVIYDLSEDASLTTIHRADPMIGLSDSYRIADYCATRPLGQIITLFIGCSFLKVFVPSVFEEQTLYRAQIAKLFNRGNTVITNIHIPYLISGTQPASLYRAYLNRILFGIYNNRTIVFEKGEMPNYSITLSTDKLAAKQIASYVSRRTRNGFELSHREIPLEIYLRLIVTELNESETPIRLNVMVDRIGEKLIESMQGDDFNDKELTIRQWIREAIDDYDRAYNSD
jgi:hypothetical protein